MDRKEIVAKKQQFVPSISSPHFRFTIVVSSTPASEWTASDYNMSSGPFSLESTSFLCL